MISVSCQRAPSEPASAVRDAGASAHTGVVFMAPRSEGEVPPIVVEALAQTARERRTLLVYAGATWCEPCQRFHQAALHGELDADFPSLTVLEFDIDRDRERLAQAGYTAKYIPLFVLPQTDGTASHQMSSGGIKGEGAVADLVPRLKQLLER